MANKTDENPVVTPQVETATTPAPAQTPVAVPGQVQYAPRPLTGWASFIGVLSIIQGIMATLTIIGALIGIPIIIAGAKLLSAVKTSRTLVQSGDATAIQTVKNLNTYFKVMGIIIVVSFCIGLFTSLVMFILVATGAWQNLIPSNLGLPIPQ
jgi:NADH:ubiquinone oxidoreductase subunit 4 (subunit M)